MIEHQAIKKNSLEEMIFSWQINEFTNEDERSGGSVFFVRPQLVIWSKIFHVIPGTGFDWNNFAVTNSRFENSSHPRKKVHG